MKRRSFIKGATLGAAASALLGPRSLFAGTKRPNILFIIADQLSWDAISAHGSIDARTPNLDRLVARGVSFAQSYSASPVCCPARVSFMTGRMPEEHGVVQNDLVGVKGLPTVAGCLADAGYENFYFGKTHLPGYESAAGLEGFKVRIQYGGHAAVSDPLCSRATENFLRNRTSSNPFFCVSSLVHPHDICYWHIHRKFLVPSEIPFPALAAELPAVPPSNRYDFPEPERLAKTRITAFSDPQWRWYLYNYYRMVELLDAEIGRILDALDESGLAQDTLVCFTSDHGEGGGRHARVQKWNPYEETARVPLIFSYPGRLPEGERIARKLVSGIDLFPTFCDFAGVKSPALPLAKSLRPLLEKRETPWRPYLVYETQVDGRTVRSERHKWARYPNDPVELLFDLKEDPIEMKNLYAASSQASVVEDHRRMLAEWNSRLTPSGMLLKDKKSDESE